MHQGDSKVRYQYICHIITDINILPTSDKHNNALFCTVVSSIFSGKFISPASLLVGCTAHAVYCLWKQIDNALKLKMRASPIVVLASKEICEVTFTMIITIFHSILGNSPGYYGPCLNSCGFTGLRGGEFCFYQEGASVLVVCFTAIIRVD